MSRRPLTLGLTGSIGMGKSTVAAMFADAGIPVFNADAAVHRLQGRGGRLVAAIEAAFPDTTGPDGVDRTALGEAVLGQPHLLKQLEAIVHPLVAAGRAGELAEAAGRGVKLAVLDIPLLYEGGGQKSFHAVVVVTAAPEVQAERVLARPGMTRERFEAIVERQVPDAEKRRLADFIVETDRGLEAAREQVKAIVATVLDPDWVSPQR